MAYAKDIIMKYLDEARLMQIATCSGVQPWCATVYFAVDNLHNIFWLSLPTRRHSQEIASNPKVAGAIVLPHTYGDKVHGLQFQGMAVEVTDRDEILKHIVTIEERYQRPNLGEQIISGSNPHHLYQIRPELFALFDELNFPGGEAQVWHVKENVS